MVNQYRIEKDKFQILTNKLSDAIMGYFMGMNPETVLDNVHACHSVLMDICNFYSGTAKPKGKKQPLIEPTKTIERPALFTEQLDSEGQKFFRRRRVDGKAGLYVDIGNAVKHADSDTEAATLILDQHAYEYLFALIRDYQSVREALLEAEIIQRQDGLYTGYVPGHLKVYARRLTNAFLEASGVGSVPKFYPPEPFIDTSMRLFFNWAYFINADMAKSNMDDKDPFWDTIRAFAFEPFEQQRIIRGMYKGTQYFGMQNIRTHFLEQQGKVEPGTTDKIVQRNRRFLKEAMRNSSRQVVFDILMRRKREYYGTSDSGYHFKSDDARKPALAGTFVKIDPHGFDHS